MLHRGSYRNAPPILQGGASTAWTARAWRLSSIDAAETVDALCPQRARAWRVEQAVNDGFAYGSHGAGSCG